MTGAVNYRDSAPGEPLTLAGFVAARLSEDEAIAREAAGLTECWVAEEPAIGVVLVDGEPLIEGHITGLTAHIALHDPARVLREVEAKRRILKRHRNCGSGIGYCDDGGHGSDGTGPGCAEMRDLAAPYTDHPEFDQAWLT